ncbi:MAG: class I SAM-dependent methyltransferase [Flavobacteriales bacterium]
MKKSASVDVIGLACKEFVAKGQAADIVVNSSINEESIIPVSYLFRTYNEMPEIEHVALAACKGKVLEIGAGVGSHALELQNRNIEVVALDNSQGCCEVAVSRGVKNFTCQQFNDKIEGKFDTILMMMNGIGVCGTIKGLEDFLERAKGILAPNGQIIFDSCDILYMFLDEDGSINFDLNGAYYGEVEYQMSFKKNKGEAFKWLFIDEDKMKEIAEKQGYSFEILFKEEEGMYLVRLGQ